MQHAFRLLQRLESRSRIATLDKDMSGSLAARTYERHFAQFRLHQPLEDHRQPTVDKEHIRHRLMVSYKDVRGVAVDVLQSGYTYRQEQQVIERTRPERLDVMQPPAVTPVLKDDRGDSREYGYQRKQR